MITSAPNGFYMKIMTPAEQSQRSTFSPGQTRLECYTKTKPHGRLPSSDKKAMTRSMEEPDLERERERETALWRKKQHHVNILILRKMMSGIPLLLGLRIKMRDPFVYVVFWEAARSLRLLLEVSLLLASLVQHFGSRIRTPGVCAGVLINGVPLAHSVPP